MRVKQQIIASSKLNKVTLESDPSLRMVRIVDCKSLFFLSPLSVCSPPGMMSPQMGHHFPEVPYRSDRRPYPGKFSTLPSQENTTPGRCTDMASLPGGATPTHHQRWSNPADSSLAWGTVQHTCHRPLTEYRVYSHDFITAHVKEWEGRQEHRQVVAQDGCLKQDCKPEIPPRVPRSITDVDLSEPNVSFMLIATQYWDWTKEQWTKNGNSFSRYSADWLSQENFLWVFQLPFDPGWLDDAELRVLWWTCDQL